MSKLLSFFISFSNDISVYNAMETVNYRIKCLNEYIRKFNMILIHTKLPHDNSL